MAVGQVLSSSSLVGSRIFDTPSLNNTGISSKQISPVDLSGKEQRVAPTPGLAPVAQTYNAVGQLATTSSAPVSGQRLNATA